VKRSIRLWMAGLSVAAVMLAPIAGVSAMQGGQPRAADGRTLSDEPEATQTIFIIVWGDAAASRWVEEHNAALARMAPPAPAPRTGEGPQTSDREVPGTGPRGPSDAAPAAGAAGAAATGTPATSGLPTPGLAGPSMPPPGAPVPGMLPPGVTDPAMLPPGLVPPGSVPPGAVPPGVIPPGLSAPGMVPPGSMPAGAPGQPGTMQNPPRTASGPGAGTNVQPSNPPVAPPPPTPFPTPYVRGGSGSL
jgi:hypothetical protein